jgi:flavin-dependent dehydrogenase
MARAHDVIIVGARCAGASLARLLALQGLRVLLVDRARFPSDTLSTHLLPPLGVEKLSEWNLLDRLLASGCPKVSRVRLQLDDIVIDASLQAVPTTTPFAVCPRRRILDQILVDAAIEAGAEFRPGFAVADLLMDGQKVRGIRGRVDDVEYSEGARLVVGADGRDSFVARRLGVPTYFDRGVVGPVGFYAYYGNLDMQGRIETMRSASVAVGAWPTHDGLTLVSIGWHPARFQVVRRDIAGHFARALRDVPALSGRAEKAVQVERFRGTPSLPNFYRQAFGPGWALAGDAGHTKDPTTASGIADAFFDAESLASAIASGFSGKCSFAKALLEHERRRHRRTISHYHVLTRFIAPLKPLGPLPRRLLLAARDDARQAERLVGAMVGARPVNDFFSVPNFYRALGWTGLLGSAWDHLSWHPPQTAVIQDVCE